MKMMFIFLCLRILKQEYVRTNNQTITKSRFPSLLSQLWNWDPLQTKTNLIKSFMRSGVFPLNPNAIDRSKILKNNSQVSTSSSIHITPSTNPPVNSSDETDSVPPINVVGRTISD